MVKALAPIGALLLAAAFFSAGNGLQGTLIAVRANLEAFPISAIGLLMSAYFVGFIAGCIVNPRLVERVGHIRAYSALAAIASAAVIIHALWVSPYAWVFLRIIVGFCFAGLYLIAESWINERATNENRGRVLSIYRIVDLGALTVGQALLTLADPMGFPLFCIVAILISVALVPVSLTAAVAPRPIETANFTIMNVLHTSPFAAWACCAAGLANGAFWGLGPVFIQNAGFGVESVASFMSMVVVGGVLVQYPLGHWSDHIDRRFVLISIALASAGASGLLAYSPVLGLPMILSAGFLYGAFSMSLYSMAIAHANDRAEKEDFVEISSGLLFLYGAGAAAGPFMAGLLIGALGNGMLFVYTGIVQATLAAYGLYRLSQSTGVPVAEQEDFVPLTRTTPQVLELDPRSDVDLTPQASDEPASDNPAEMPDGGDAASVQNACPRPI